MNETSRQKLIEVIENNKSWPILIKGVDSSFFGDAAVIPATTPSAELGIIPNAGGYQVPQWLKTLESRKSEQYNFLVIDRIDEITQHDQMKFLEILKNKSISGHKFPENTRIMLTVGDKSLVNKEVLANVITWSV